MKNNIIYLFIFLFISVSTTAQISLDGLLKKHNTNNIPYVSATELRMYQILKEVIILDSREKNEFDVSHIPSAIYVGYNEFSIEGISEMIPDKNTAIVVYCTLGIRSETISSKLLKAGYTNIKNLYGGICEWKNTNYPVYDSVNIKTENVHTFSKQWGKWLINGTQIYD